MRRGSRKGRMSMIRKEMRRVKSALNIREDKTRLDTVRQGRTIIIPASS